jgi:hypothetical protein
MRLLSRPFSKCGNDHRLGARAILVFETDVFDSSRMGSALLSRVL